MLKKPNVRERVTKVAITLQWDFFLREIRKLERYSVMLFKVVSLGSKAK